MPVLNRVLLQAWQSVKQRSSREAGQHPESLGLIRQLWALRRQRFQAPSTHSVLRGWLQATKLARTQRLLRKACKARKRERIKTLLQEAENSRQPSAIFSVVRRLAPKSRTLRIQLIRDKEGRLLAGVEESNQIASFLRTVFHGENTQEAPEGAPFTSVQFEATELLKALSQLGGRKALPSTFAPASLWKLAPTQVTKALLPIINHAYDSTSPAAFGPAVPHT